MSDKNVIYKTGKYKLIAEGGNPEYGLIVCQKDKQGRWYTSDWLDGYSGFVDIIIDLLNKQERKQ